MKDIKLFVVSHKKLKNERYPEREIIYVGKNQKKFATEKDYVDSDGINIAEKNPLYCEVTAMYYIWKNINADIVGIEHYRRLFSNLFRIRNKKWAEKKLEKCDFIVFTEFPFFKTMKYQLIQHHGQFAYDALEDAIKTLYPDYLDTFYKVMKGTHLAWFNMMITTKDNFDDYMKFLTDILFYIEKKITIPEDPYLRRIMGFISERILSVYLRKNKFKVKHSLVSFTARYKN